MYHLKFYRFALTAIASGVILAGCGDNNNSAATLKDTTAPTLAIASNITSNVAKKQFTVSGSATDETAIKSVTASVGGGEAINLTIDKQGNFSGDVTLKDGDNEVVVTVTDSAGNTKQKTISVVLDSIKPTLALESDIVDEVSRVSKIVITGQASDNKELKDVDITVNGQTTPQITLNTNGSFSTMLDLVSGNNDIVVTVTDKAGNQSSQKGAVYYGNTLAGGNAHTMVIVNNKVYGWGRNNYGQVGIGKTTSLKKDAIHPKLPTLISGLPNNIVSVAINQNHSAALTKEGKVYTWGDDSDGQLGRGDQGRQDCGTRGKENCRLDIGMTNLPQIQALDSGYDHVLALSKDGDVWAFGDNSSGQLGATSDIKSSSTPVKVNFTDNVGNIVQVIASSKSSYALDDKGQVWAWGRNRYGNLGQGEVCSRREGCTDFNATPIKVKLPKSVVITEVATGRDHVLALSSSGKVYAWGLNASSQVGYMGNGYKGTDKAWERQIPTPTLLPWFTDKKMAKHVYANGNTSYVMLSDDKVYPWGMFGETNAEGRTTYLNLNEPTDKLTSLTQVVDMGVGILHQIAKRQDESLFSWGWSFEGSLGGNDVTNIWMYNTPIIIKLPK